MSGFLPVGQDDPEVGLPAQMAGQPTAGTMPVVASP
jgi:hypothetical protein